MTGRTRLGKTVGSYRPPLEGWTATGDYSGGPGWTVLAPSGARFEAGLTEGDARRLAAARNAADAAGLVAN